MSGSGFFIPVSKGGKKRYHQPVEMVTLAIQPPPRTYVKRKSAVLIFETVFIHGQHKTMYLTLQKFILWPYFSYYHYAKFVGKNKKQNH